MQLPGSVNSTVPGDKLPGGMPTEAASQVMTWRVQSAGTWHLYDWREAPVQAGCAHTRLHNRACADILRVCTLRVSCKSLDGILLREAQGYSLCHCHEFQLSDLCIAAGLSGKVLTVPGEVRLYSTE